MENIIRLLDALQGRTDRRCDAAILEPLFGAVNKKK